MLPIHDPELQRTKLELEEFKTRLRRAERMLNKLQKFCVNNGYPSMAKEIESILWSNGD